LAFTSFLLFCRKEVEAMLGLTLEETRVYREAKAEGREEILKAAVPLLLKTGMSIEQIAQQLNVDQSFLDGTRKRYRPWNQSEIQNPKFPSPRIDLWGQSKIQNLKSC
jgi:hypothetical protein